MLQIQVNDVKPSQEKVNTTTASDIITSTLNTSNLFASCGGVLACSHDLQEEFAALVSWDLKNQLVMAVHLAFARHYPLVVKPDVIWVTILQGLSAHINSDPEKYRKLLVAHEGKEELEVVDDALPPDWSFFANKCAQLAKSHVVNRKLSEAMSLKFSTTGPIEQTAFSMVLMDTLKAYFEYRCWTRCGIPYIKLGGTRSDWKTMTQHLSCLDDFGLQSWREQLQGILFEFVAAFDGNINHDFWNGIYKWNGPQGSGEEAYITGWLTMLFPYLETGERNPAVWQPANKAAAGCGSLGRRRGLNVAGGGPLPRTDLADIRASLTATPVTHCIFGQEYKRMFVAGVLGVQQCSDSYALEPIVGWAVTEEKQVPGK